MIRSFKHRGLKRLYENGDKRGIRADHLETVENILTVLDAASTPQALNLPRYRLHQQGRYERIFGGDRPSELENHLHVSGWKGL